MGGGGESVAAKLERNTLKRSGTIPKNATKRQATKAQRRLNRAGGI